MARPATAVAARHTQATTNTHTRAWFVSAAGRVAPHDALGRSMDGWMDGLVATVARTPGIMPCPGAICAGGANDDPFVLPASAAMLCCKIACAAYAAAFSSVTPGGRTSKYDFLRRRTMRSRESERLRRELRRWLRSRERRRSRRSRERLRSRGERLRSRDDRDLDDRWRRWRDELRSRRSRSRLRLRRELRSRCESSRLLDDDGSWRSLASRFGGSCSRHRHKRRACVCVSKSVKDQAVDVISRPHTSKRTGASANCGGTVIAGAAGCAGSCIGTYCCGCAGGGAWYAWWYCGGG